MKIVNWCNIVDFIKFYRDEKNIEILQSFLLVLKHLPTNWEARNAFGLSIIMSATQNAISESQSSWFLSQLESLWKIYDGRDFSFDFFHIQEIFP